MELVNVAEEIKRVEEDIQSIDARNVKSKFMPKEAVFQNRKRLIKRLFTLYAQRDLGKTVTLIDMEK